MALGNHDQYDNWSFVNLRIRNPLYIETQNHYFSFNWEGIHFTEVNFEYFDNVTPEMQEEIFAWIENDLKIANQPENREKFPWIVFITHRPIYCSYIEQGAIPEYKWCYYFYSVRKIWDELLHKYSVDLVLAADKHSYERYNFYDSSNNKFSKEWDQSTKIKQLISHRPMETQLIAILSIQMLQSIY